MAFSMHSHSGQFCPGHAVDDLEVVLQTAIGRGFHSFSFTEHMPLESDEDLYPGDTTAAPLWPRHHAYLLEATRLREKYAISHPDFKILIGFEGEWIRPSYGPLMLSLAADPRVDYFIGSVHHVHAIPIDYDASFYARAIAASSPPTEEGLYCDYFDSQHSMLLALHPRVIGHFDLIRLLSSEPDRDLRQFGDGKVWEKIVRNLRVVVEQGGMLEVNTSALRKGLQEPYPGRAICVEYLKMGGKFTLSDDSHGVTHIGTNYERAFLYLEGLGVTKMWTLDQQEGQIGALSSKSIPLETIKRSLK